MPTALEVLRGMTLIRRLELAEQRPAAAFHVVGGLFAEIYRGDAGAWHMLVAGVYVPTPELVGATGLEEVQDRVWGKFSSVESLSVLEALCEQEMAVLSMAKMELEDGQGQVDACRSQIDDARERAEKVIGRRL